MARKPTQDDLDMGQMAESELDRLQRQYRIMEGDRNAFCKEIYSSLRKQRKTIACLSKERRNLKLNLQVFENPVNELKDKQTASELHKLMKRSNKYESESKNRTAQLNELKQQIFKMEKELRTLRRKEVTDTQSLSQAAEYKSKIETLENRLNVVTVKYNKMLAVNTSLREELDHLLKERSHFNNLYQQLICQLNLGKKAMVDLIEQATVAYDQREEAQVKLQALKERSRQDHVIHGQEMRELMRKLDYDAKLQDFLGAKGQKRVMADLEAKEAAKKLAQKEDTEEMIAEYQSILVQIKEFTGEEQIDRLAAQFVKQEEENFALFNYVGELNNELEAIQDQVEAMQVLIDNQHAINKQRAEEQHDTLIDLQENLETCTVEATIRRDKLGATQYILDELLVGIEEVFQTMQLSNAPLLELLGDNTQVTQFNVTLYLGIIKRRIMDVSKIISSKSQQNELTDLLTRLKINHISINGGGAKSSPMGDFAAFALNNKKDSK